ncbi:MAG: putative serine/threonine-protein kinase Nek6 [Streblomastix strix]|uniref:non-specific serine/threonine protein kinase n=1 Tax=Streblomastix strix TaxID=222440 RepID=A0A5J4VN33_9EUKA|nr:MAG: putative serine/threonine-protein kinase Nek6 [Streblomastix strix]
MPRYEDYRIIRKLPGGAQSKTYLVELKSTRQQFIMKKVDYLEDVDRAKADLEVELLRQLDSDFTVHLVCIVETDVDLCMILEYCVRGDFRNLIDEFQQLPQSEKLMRGWEYTAQITRALDHLHSHNVMHCDLKPANILVNQDGSIRLGDFGLSREMNEDYYKTITGTKVYMAPEVHLLKRMNFHSDIFSLGVIIFQLITGHHPFESDSEEAMIDKIKKNQVSQVPDWVSNQMKEINLSMMNNDENHRPTTKMILCHDTVLMYLRLSEDQQKSEQEKINALNERDVIVEERNRLQRDNEIALAERDGERQEKERAQVELNRANIEKDRLQIELNRANIEKDRLQAELNRERQEKERAQTEKDREKQRTNSAEELTGIFQQQVERTHSEVTRLTTENQQLKAELSRRETVPSTPKAQLKQTPVPTPKPKQASLIQVTSSPQPITVNLQVPTGMSGHKEQNIFKHDNTEAHCTITSDPIISDGIVYYESVFENHGGGYYFGIGIADSTVVFKPNKWPTEDGKDEKTVYYRYDGRLFHINRGLPNQKFVCGQRIGAEVNMSSNPRKLTFFIDDIEQQNYLINIPQAIRFWSYIHDSNSSFRVTRFERRSSSSAHGVTGSQGWEWGKDWYRQ